MTQKRIKPVIQRTNTISFKRAEFYFWIKKIDVLRVKKINKEKINKYTNILSNTQQSRYTLFIIPGKKYLRYRKKQ